MQDHGRTDKQKMVRKQVLITKDQDRRLKSSAAAAGTTVAELIRAGIDRELTAGEGVTDWKERLLSAAGTIKDASHLESVVKANRANWRKRTEQIKRKLAGEE